MSKRILIIYLAIGIVLGSCLLTLDVSGIFKKRHQVHVHITRDSAIKESQTDWLNVKIDGKFELMSSFNGSYHEGFYTLPTHVNFIAELTEGRHYISVQEANLHLADSSDFIVHGETWVDVILSEVPPNKHWIIIRAKGAPRAEM